MSLEKDLKRNEEEIVRLHNLHQDLIEAFKEEIDALEQRINEHEKELDILRERITSLAAKS